MNLAIRIAAAILSVPPDVIAPHVPMMAPPPRNNFEVQLRIEVNTLLSGGCSAADRGAPLFAISNEEANFVDCNSGLPGVMDVYKSGDNDNAASTYGEITMLGARQLFHHMGLTTKKSGSNNHGFHFYDLGSGGGRLVIQSYLERPSISNSVGIELSSSRHEIAKQTHNHLLHEGEIERIRNLARRAWGTENKEAADDGIELHEGDLFKLDISKATHIYASSLCFSEKMLEMLVDKIEREATSLEVIASLRMLPLKKETNKKALVRIGRNPWQEWIEMSWTKAIGEGCPVYLYSVEKI